MIKHKPNYRLQIEFQAKHEELTNEVLASMIILHKNNLINDKTRLAHMIEAKNRFPYGCVNISDIKVYDIVEPELD